MNSNNLSPRAGIRNWRKRFALWEQLITWERFVTATCAGLFGLAAARALFETLPLLFGGLRWQAGLLIGLVLAIIAAARPFLFRPARKAFILLPLALPILSIFDSATNPLRDWVLILGGLGGVAAILFRHQVFPKHLVSERTAYPLTLALITSVLYLRTLAPTVGEADTFEFQVNAIRLGISHGSGYPLYLILAKLFSLLPIPGTAAFRINLSSAAFGVAAALMAYAVARALGASRPAAWIAGLSLAASTGLWSRAVEAEVYTLHVALAGLLLFLALRPLESNWEVVIGNWAFGTWDLLFFTLGLSLTNHLTTILLAPAIVIALIANRKSQTPRWNLRLGILRFGIWILLFFLGLSLYLYLPLRWPAVNNGEAMTWELFKHFITGQEAQGALRLDAWLTDFSRYAIVGRKALDQFGWPGAMAALVGLAALFRQRPTAALVTFTAWAAYAFFGLSFYVPDPDYSSFLLPAHFVQAVWIAVGITAIFNTQYPIFKTRPHWVLSIGYCVFFLLPASLVWTNLPRVDQSTDWREYRLGQYILSQPLKENAAILADSELIAPLYYLQAAEGIRPDLDIVVLPNEETYRAELDARLANGQAVYLGRYLPHLAGAYYLHSVGPLAEVKLEPGQLPESFTPLNQDFDSIIRLRGFTLDSSPVPTDHSLPITLYWQALQPPSGNYRVVFQLLNANGEVCFTSPANVPVGQMYPTAAWPLDDVVADFHNIALDPALEPGAYTLQVGLFPPFSAEALGSWAALADVTLQPPVSSPRIASPLRVRFANGIWLMGIDAPSAAAPGSKIETTLYWLLPPGLSGPVTADVCSDNPCSPLAPIPLNPASRPASRLIETRTTFNAPTPTGQLPLWIKLDDQEAACGWWSSPSPTCKAAEIKIEGSPLAAEAINFDNQIALESLQIETPAASPGQTVVVTARWRGLRPMESDYTVFIHLLGPDGIVHGQVDMWPVQGTLPTTQWPINEPIADRFEVRVPDDAPPGEYKVEAGWYLLATLDRLPVLDADGVAIDDRFLLTGLTIR